MKASIIIPSYNSNERLYYNLLSLNNQDYDFKEFEAVVVDNGSTDNTIGMLKKFQNRAKFTLKFTRLEENKGIACGRNTAVKMAEGDILIFHDSDMIAPRDFVSRHLKDHEEKNVVVCSVSWKRIVSFYYKELENNGPHYEGLSFVKASPCKSEKFPILNERLIKSGAYMNYAFDLDNGFINEIKDILKKHNGNLSEYALPWRMFITNNASAEREDVIKVGMFDEGIVGYGFEDYDLGIRLYKLGCKFVFDENILNVHQEHPTNNKIDEYTDNVGYMCNKYDSIYFIDVILVCMGYITSIDKSYLNELVCEINEMLKIDYCRSILKVFLELLQIKRRKSLNDHQNNSSSSMIINYINQDEFVNLMMILENFYGIKYFPKAIESLLNDIFS
ncbi:MAG: glycosyltransferase family 2 protein [Clostridium sp.]|nr:glycosyltransferase family 2 protein [Clostridium sp.]